MANRKFTSCYNIKIVNRFCGKKYMLLSLNKDLDFLCFNATFNNISAISWRPVLVSGRGVSGEDHRPWPSN